MASAMRRALLTGLILGSAVLLLPETAGTRTPVAQTSARADVPTCEDARGGHQLVPPGWTLYAPVSPDDLLMRPDEGDGLMEITCDPMPVGVDSASYVAGWEAKRVGPNHLLLKKQAGRIVDLDGEVAYEGVYEGEDLLAKVLFLGVSDRFYVFLGVFRRDDFGRGEATLNRLVERFRAQHPAPSH